MTDRFANGDPSTDNQGTGEFDIQGLGATAVWITPPVANQK